MLKRVCEFIADPLKTKILFCIKKGRIKVKKLWVELGDKSYNIFFNTSFNNLCEALESVNAPGKLLIVTDSNVKELYADEVCNILIKAGYDACVFAFPAGEENKGMDTILSVCKACIEHEMDRKSMIVALGGGVVGDMAGFAAAIYMRGIKFVQVPTTLLSQSDSSVGGKTGIDFMNVKNILGAFHQPKMVYINVSTLKTLPEKEFISGMGEVIKHGIIRNKDFFEYIYNNIEKVKELECETLLEMAYTNCSVKSDVVSRDEFENGLRADLNFGHTIGHAVEAHFDFSLTHGECVGLGMIAAAYISYKRGNLEKEAFEKIEKILSNYGFKTKVCIKNPDAVKALMQKDKKKSSGKLKFVLPEKIGTVIQTSDVSSEEIDAAIGYINEC